MTNWGGGHALHNDATCTTGWHDWSSSPVTVETCNYYNAVPAGEPYDPSFCVSDPPPGIGQAFTRSTCTAGQQVLCHD